MIYEAPKDQRIVLCRRPMAVRTLPIHMQSGRLWLAARRPAAGRKTCDFRVKNDTCAAETCLRRTLWPAMR